MLLLAFDTTAACSIALVKDGATLAGVREVTGQGQAEILIPLIGQVMKDARVCFFALDRIAVTVGPGSFTGVRIGLAAARALGLAANKPVVGVSSLEVLAAAAPREERARFPEMIAAIDSGRGDVYLQSFEALSLEPKSEPVALAPADVTGWAAGGEVLVVGNAARVVAGVLPRAAVSRADPLPDAAVLAGLAAKANPTAGGPLPLYVLPPKVTLAPGGGRLRPAPTSTREGA
jgi:tRNA threonylcarbamoyladenosine biosynthesis protein TsaB